MKKKNLLCLLAQNRSSFNEGMHKQSHRTGKGWRSGCPQRNYGESLSLTSCHVGPSWADHTRVLNKDWTPSLWDLPSLTGQSVFPFHGPTVMPFVKHKYIIWFQNLSSLSYQSHTQEGKESSAVFTLLKVMFKVRDFLFVFLPRKHEHKITGNSDWEVSVYVFIQTRWNTSFLISFPRVCFMWPLLSS